MNNFKVSELICCICCNIKGELSNSFNFCLTDRKEIRFLSKYHLSINFAKFYFVHSRLGKYLSFPPIFELIYKEWKECYIGQVTILKPNRFLKSRMSVAFKP